MNCRRILSLLVALSSVTAAANFSQAQICVSGGGDAVILRETFDGLPASGKHAWTDNATLAGWYANQQEFAAIGANRKPTPSPGMYSFGGAGLADRALGATAGIKSPVLIGVRLVNETAQTIDAADVAYVIRQFRTGDLSNAVKLEYQIFQPGQGDIEAGQGWLSLSAADFTNAQEGNEPLDPPLLHPRSAALAGLEWKPGSELWLRWVFTKKRNNGSALGIDTVTITNKSGKHS